MQFTFSTSESLIKQVDELASREERSRSEMIGLLLGIAIKEKTRRRNGKKDNTEYNPADTCEGNAGR